MYLHFQHSYLGLSPCPSLCRLSLAQIQRYPGPTTYVPRHSGCWLKSSGPIFVEPNNRKTQGIIFAIIAIFRQYSTRNKILLVWLLWLQGIRPCTCVFQGGIICKHKPSEMFTVIVEADYYANKIKAKGYNSAYKRGFSPKMNRYKERKNCLQYEIIEINCNLHIY